ncbi:MAG: response regulator transcription factor [Rhodospirillales bacterium]|nr:response regulator transcription factor [Rhodospirillales bacterium]
MKVLVIEDDAETASFVSEGLKRSGHTADCVSTGPEGLQLAMDDGYDALIVDRMLPGLDGVAVVKALRSAGVNTPVLFLTALDGVADRVLGLDAGGDDYLVKPFAFSELLARLRALQRRSSASTDNGILTVGDLVMDTRTWRVTRGGRRIDLQPREFRLLEYLMRHSGEVVTRTMLLEKIWDFNFDPRTSVVETHISRIRAKVDRPFEVPLIKTIRGVGYMIDAA